MTSPVYSVWRECAAPELGGRQVFVWDGVAVQAHCRAAKNSLMLYLDIRLEDMNIIVSLQQRAHAPHPAAVLDA